MKYIVMDWKGNDLFTKEFDNKEAAIAEAKRQFAYLEDGEQMTRNFYVLESVNPDEEAEDHYDGNEVWRPSRYVVRDREAGNIFDACDTYEEAESVLKAYEDEDKRDGNYIEDFYEIAERDNY